MVFRRTALVVAVLVSLAGPLQAAGLDAPAGASSCSGCHPAGASVETPVPRLVGRPAADIVAKMQAFRAGQLPGTVMGRIAKGFSDEEIAAIASWYGAQQD